MTTIAVLDANVLIPNALCDLLLRLAEEELCQPRWSPAILEEVRRHVPVSPAAIERRFAFMNAAFEDAMVTGYEALIDQMDNDPKDRHVLAAAVAAGADSIITCNLRDFPLAACEPHGVVAEHPDVVLLDMWAREPRILLRVLGEQAASTGRHGTRLNVHQILDYLATAGARRFAAAARSASPPDGVPPLPCPTPRLPRSRDCPQAPWSGSVQG
ncbi:PIN domain-containing protein [Micromonospora sp. WMMD1128]|uniref:PIN domain-containing protein n=1 Tax=Micromonospora sp. WMMD1128 TaxID=3015150 RepID=UPI00248B1EF5|nr:PIN domain-containing protein [Micromonospora sp. WMMD1128]WBB75051.1 PIN domain-containing protein [Micromonospora sp. WMMD1128]